MSKFNYNKMSGRPASPVSNEVEEPAEVETPVVNEPEVNTTESEVSDGTTMPEYVEGVVTGCAMLNVRETPSLTGAIMHIIAADTAVEVIPQECTSDDWYKVRVERGCEGYCMKKYISLNQ